MNKYLKYDDVLLAITEMHKIVTSNGAENYNSANTLLEVLDVMILRTQHYTVSEIKREECEANNE